MNPGQTKLTDAQYAEMIEKIKAALKKKIRRSFP